MSEEINQALKQIESRKKQLVEVADPTTVLKGSIEIDSELHKLAKNLKVLTDLEFIAGNESIRLEKEYNKKTMELAIELTVEKLEELAVVKSNKFKYIKFKLHQEESDMETMKAKHKYFKNMRETYTEWGNIYKKTRYVGDQQ